MEQGSHIIASTGGAGGRVAVERGAGVRGAGKRGAGKRDAVERGTGVRGAGKRGAGKEGTGELGAGGRVAGGWGAGKRVAGERGAGEQPGGCRMPLTHRWSWTLPRARAGAWPPGARAGPSSAVATLPLVASLLMVLGLGAAGCPGPGTTRCGEATCPRGYSCDPIHELCVLPSQLEDCRGLPDGTACTVRGAGGYVPVSYTFHP